MQTVDYSKGRILVSTDWEHHVHQDERLDDFRPIRCKI